MAAWGRRTSRRGRATGGWDPQAPQDPQVPQDAPVPRT